MITSFTSFASTPRSARPRSGGRIILRARRGRRCAARITARAHEGGIDGESAGLRAGEPDEIVEIARALVRVAADEVLARLAVREAFVPDRGNILGVGEGQI